MDQKMNCTMQGETAYKLKHIASNIDRNVETIRRAVRKKKLKAYMSCGEYYVLESDLNKWLRGEVWENL